MIDIIYIYIEYNDIVNNKIYDFLEMVKCIKLPIFIFTDSISKNVKINNVYNLNIEYIYMSSNIKTSIQIFKFMMNYMHDIYRIVLLLDINIIVKDNFIKYIETELIKYSNDFYIYGSKYYGDILNSNYILKNYLCNVAVYNRNEILLKYINMMNINNTQCFETYLFSILYKNEKDLINKYIDGKYVLNMSRNNKYIYKSDAKIILYKDIMNNQDKLIKKLTLETIYSYCTLNNIVNNTINKTVYRFNLIIITLKKINRDVINKYLNNVSIGNIYIYGNDFIDENIININSNKVLNFCNKFNNNFWILCCNLDNINNFEKILDMDFEKILDIDFEKNIVIYNKNIIFKSQLNISNLTMSNLNTLNLLISEYYNLFINEIKKNYDIIYI